jgi:aspartyl-tRNA(Asn)/glutamyl-tRNA(Gln) amidotransferase subunit A
MNILMDGVDALLIPSADNFASFINFDENPDVNRLKEREKELGETKSVVTDLLKLANFAGTPSITIPVKTNSLPFGINLNTKLFQDQKVLDIAYTIEEVLDV